MLSLPDRPVMSDLDPDAMGILCRNLIDNALRHGASDRPVEVTLSTGGMLSVANDGPAVPADTLSRLTSRFERGNAGAGGSGLGLAIVAALAERLGRKLILHSPRPGQDQGFEASISLPVDGVTHCATRVVRRGTRTRHDQPNKGNENEQERHEARYQAGGTEVPVRPRGTSLHQPLRVAAGRCSWRQ